MVISMNEIPMDRRRKSVTFLKVVSVHISTSEEDKGTHLPVGPSVDFDCWCPLRIITAMVHLMLRIAKRSQLVRFSSFSLTYLGAIVRVCTETVARKGVQQTEEAERTTHTSVFRASQFSLISNNFSNCPIIAAPW